MICSEGFSLWVWRVINFRFCFFEKKKMPRGWRFWESQRKAASEREREEKKTAASHVPQLFSAFFKPSFASTHLLPISSTTMAFAVRSAARPALASRRSAAAAAPRRASVVRAEGENTPAVPAETPAVVQVSFPFSFSFSFFFPPLFLPLSRAPARDPFRRSAPINAKRLFVRRKGDSAGAQGPPRSSSSPTLTCSYKKQKTGFQSSTSGRLRPDPGRPHARRRPRGR